MINGIVVNGLLDQQILNENMNAKNKIFTKFFLWPKNIKYEKKKVTILGDYPIKNLLYLDQIFKKILEKII